MISKFFVYAGYLVLLINFLLMIKGFSTKEKPFKIFTVYCGAMVLVQMTSFALHKMNVHNIFLSHFYFILQFIILSFFYKAILQNSFQKKVVIYTLILCLVLLSVQFLLDWKVFFQFNLFEIFITSLPLIIYATFHLYNLLNEKKEYYYFNLGLLIYLFGSTVVFLTGNLLILLKSDKPFTMIWDLNVYLYVVYQLFIFYELKMILMKKEE